MNVHKIVMTVIDFEGLGLKRVISTIEKTRYANDCINPTVLSGETRDIGEWSDDHPLNSVDTYDAEIERLFSVAAQQQHQGGV